MICGTHLLSTQRPKKQLIERGRQLLLKDNLLDEEILKKQEENEETTSQAVTRLETSLDTLQTRFARLLCDFNTTQQRLKQRITKLEKILAREDDAISKISNVSNTES